MSKITNFIRKYITEVSVFFFALIFFVLSILDIYHCPQKFLFGIPCPFCGITRAIVCILTLNFKESFYYHALWPLFVFGVPIYLLFIKNAKKISEKNKDILLIVIALIFLIYYIIRIINHSPIVQMDFTESLIYKLFH